MIAEFLKYKMQVQNLSEGTVKEYGKNLRAFATWESVHHPNTGWSQVTKQHIEEHMIAMSGARMKPRTIQLRVAALRSFYNYQMSQGRMKQSPAKYVQMPKAGQQLPATVSLEALTRYMMKPASTLATLETQALTALLVETGIRIQEALDIKPADIDKRQHSIKVNGKGNKQRVVYYGEMTAAKMNALAAHIDYTQGFFHRDQRQYREMMTNELKGIIEYIHPHMLRHTFATEMLKNGTPLKYVSELLGHESVKTTERYTHVVNTECRKAAMSQAPRLEFSE